MVNVIENALYYLPYEVDALHYFGNMVRAKEFELVRSVRQVVEGLNRTEWLDIGKETNPFKINAFYSFLNQFCEYCLQSLILCIIILMIFFNVDIYAGIMSAPVFDLSWPE